MSLAPLCALIPDIGAGYILLVDLVMHVTYGRMTFRAWRILSRKQIICCYNNITNLSSRVFYQADPT